jgi:hypothetical protein
MSRPKPAAPERAPVKQLSPQYKKLQNANLPSLQYVQVEDIQQVLDQNNNKR